MSAPSISAAPPKNLFVRRVGAEASVIHTLVPSSVKALGEDEVEVRMSTATIARDGHILVPQGARLEAYKKNPVFLWNHDLENFPVGRAESISIQGQQIVARVRFPAAGISARAEECRRLVKSGFINGVSVGFDPLDGAPLDAKNPRGGQRITDWELIECSFCCVPIDSNALVTARGRSPLPSPHDRPGRRGTTPMKSAASHLEQGLEEHRAFARHYAEIADATQRLDEHRSRLGTAMRSLQAAIQEGNTEQAAEHHARCMRCVGGINREMKAIGDRHQDAMDACNGLNRCLKSAGDVLDLGTQGEPSAGSTADQHGRSLSAAARRRQMEAIQLAAPPETKISDLELLRRSGETY